tara:strand:+ start:82 stop:273 length:192 start_codon:yes stop_codon:yes gene_type:complete
MNNIKLAPLNLVNRSFTSYLCKPMKENKSKTIEPGYCKFVYIVCNEDEICKITEIPLSSPDVN